MKIHYNVTGERRKSLVGAVSQKLAVPVKCLGMPSAAYEVGGYTISKTGELIGPDDRDLVAALRDAHGFSAMSEEYDEVPDIDQHNPGRYADPGEPPTEEMLKLAKVWMEGMPESGDGQIAESTIPEEPAAPDVLDFPNAPDRLTIAVPLKGFTPEKLDNLTGMVNAKATLLKAALGAEELPIQIDEERVKFPWFRDADGDHAQAYAALVGLLCKAALAKKRVTAREKGMPDNPKFAFRCFLVSIGMAGVEYKAARKFLLSGLGGNSAWKDGKRKGAADDE